jgi:hypothetical protein
MDMWNWWLTLMDLLEIMKEWSSDDKEFKELDWDS